MCKVLFLGGSGYVGSLVFDTLLNAHPGFTYTALVRKPEHVAHIAGNLCLQGDIDDLENIEKLASEADLVINVANSDNLPLVQAIVRGLKRRKEETGAKVAFVHTSGMLIFFEGNEGKKAAPDAKLWDDGDEEAIKSITPDRRRGDVDSAVLEAGKTGDLTTYIVCPGLVYGPSPSGKVTTFHKVIVSGAAKSGAVSVIGEGSNNFGLIHINDLADIYLRIVDKIVSSEPSPASTYARYVIGQSFERDMKSLATGIAEQMKAHGVLPSAEVRSITPAEAGPLAPMLGGAARVCARRAREDLGWKPVEPEWEEFAEREVEHALTILGIKYKHED